MTELAFDSLATPTLSPEHSQGGARLSEWGVIRAEGADAASFLQGQLTSDILGLASGAAALAGYCSAKGRLLASFVVWSPAPEVYLLACSADLLPATLKRLSMFVLRAKCRLTDASGELALWGVAGRDAGLPEGPAWTVRPAGAGQAVRLPDALGLPRWLVVQPAEDAAPVTAPLDLAAWRWLEVASGVVRIVAATVDRFVPQMVNLELVGGVNFKKGCYPGQEVVARSQYRGTLKRRALLLALPAGAQAELKEGQEIFHDADPGQPAGLVALAARSPTGEQLALVEVKLALARAPGAFRLGAADGPLLQPRALPYPLPSNDD
ncbi:CAF17-like 4Fe-4S cluster assembly/insertion protein YgfZ [Ideonella sp. YS5]|uniref:CAF17-like 4Fe-4S cluster assembly/insertion protein YgfZ n=1 Tax=Ideonella sp. YS5 TaxID=3453714 RepID=UPI003EEE4724